MGDGTEAGSKYVDLWISLITTGNYWIVWIIERLEFCAYWKKTLLYGE